MAEAESKGLTTLEQCLLALQAALRRGERPDLAAFLPAGGQCREALVEMAHAELEYRLKAGEAVRVEAYLSRYPELAEDRGAVVGLITWEYRLRCRREPALTPAELVERFPDYRPELEAYFRPARLLRDQPALGQPEIGTQPDALAPSHGSLRPAMDGTAAPAFPQVAGYEILGELGRGGMGVVYRARDLRLERLVALKMILAGSHAGCEELARFRTEAQAAARLQHPNVVQIHEVGDQEGRPYFVLEYVAGGSLDKQINGTPLQPQYAAALVRTLAAAMHAAHECGIIHRDLKPANVLLTADGTPKITDFGLAKKLDHSAGQTGSGAILGTPSYMAPEQADGQARAVGPAADVYALGAILYETLTGRPTFKGATALDTVWQVRHEEPVPPRRLQPKVPADLETICLKCLRKRPDQRYASAEALAEDLGRFRNGQPIAARPVGLWERALKWTQRRPAWAALLGVSGAAALAFVTVILVYTARLQLALKAEEEQRRQADANFQRARDAVNKFLSEVTEDPQLKEYDLREVRQRLLESAIPFYQQMAAQQPTDQHLQAERAEAYLRLGYIKGELGSYEEAITYHRQARGMLEELVETFPDKPEYSARLADNLKYLGGSCIHMKRWEEAEEAAQQARRLFEDLTQKPLASLQWHRGLAEVHLELGGIYRFTRRWPEAEAALQRGLAVFQQLRDQFPDVTEYRFGVARAYDDLGGLYHYEWRGHLPQAEAAYNAALVVFKELRDRNPRHSRYRDGLAACYRHLGVLAAMRMREPEALTAFAEALKIQEQLVREHPSVADYQVEFGFIQHGLAKTYYLNGRLEKAKTACQQTLAVRDALVQQHPTVPRYRLHQSDSQHLMGDILDRGDHAAALDWHTKAILTLVQLLAQDKRDTRIPTALVSVYASRALTLTKLGRHREAAKDWDRALELKPVRLRPWLRINRALALAHAGDHTRATREADELAQAEYSASHGAFNSLYEAARVYAQGSVAARQDEKLNDAERGTTADRYAVLAVNVLRQAMEKGFKDVEQIKKDPELKPLLQREDFQELLRTLGANPSP